MNHLHPLKNLKADIPASIVVFFVALPYADLSIPKHVLSNL